MSEALLKDAAIPGRAIPLPKPFATPTLIRPLLEKPLQWTDIAGMARHLHTARGERGLRIGKLRHASYGGSDTFPCFPIFVVDPETQAETWIGSAAFQSDQPGRLEGALRAAEPKTAAKSEAA